MLARMIEQIIDPVVERKRANLGDERTNPQSARLNAKSRRVKQVAYAE